MQRLIKVCEAVIRKACCTSRLHFTRNSMDYALPLIVLRKLSQDYETAMQKSQWALAHHIATDMVEMALKLQDVAYDK